VTFPQINFYGRENSDVAYSALHPWMDII